MAVALTPSPWQQFIDANGIPLANGRLYTYEAGSLIPATVYQDSLETPHANPIVLDALGQCTIYLPANDRAFKFVLHDSNDVPIRTQDNITWAFPDHGPPVPNLNADKLDGLDSTDFVRTPAVDSAVIPNLNADKLDDKQGAEYALVTALDALRVELKAYTDTKVAAIPPAVPTTYVPPRVVAAAANPVPNCDAHDIISMFDLTAGSTQANPTGTPEDGQPMLFRIRDNGTARPLAWGTAYMTAAYVALPTTTVVSRTLYCGFRYNAYYGKWQLVALTQEP